MSKQTKRTILILLVSQFLIMLGMSLIFPVQPFIQKEYHLTAFDMGTMSSIFALCQFIFSPIAGQWSDKTGRKVMMVWGLIIFAVGEFIFAAGNNLFWFDLARAIDGISAAMVVPVSMALVADITSVKDRAKVVGWLSAAFSGGLILGPGLGGLLANVDYKFPFWVAGVLGVISCIVLATWLPNDHTTKHQDAVAEIPTSRGFWQDTKAIMTPTMMVLCVLILITAFGLTSFESVFSLYVNQEHGFGLQAIALVLTLNGIISLILQVFLFDWMTRVLKEVGVIRLTFILAIVGTLMVMYLHGEVIIMVGTLLVFEGFDLVRPAITTLMTKLGGDKQGLLNGINTSLTSIGNILGPLLAGGLFDINHRFPYWVSIIFIAGAMLTTVWLTNMRAQSQES